MQSHLGAGPADSEVLGHFIVGEAAKLAKNEHLPVGLGSYLATNAIKARRLATGQNWP
jgi:hypothetical protein